MIFLYIGQCCIDTNNCRNYFARSHSKLRNGIVSWFRLPGWNISISYIYQVDLVICEKNLLTNNIHHAEFRWVQVLKTSSDFVSPKVDFSLRRFSTSSLWLDLDEASGIKKRRRTINSSRSIVLYVGRINKKKAVAFEIFAFKYILCYFLIWIFLHSCTPTRLHQHIILFPS